MKMKKYFMKGTEDEVQFGDIIELDGCIEMEDGTVKHRHLECKFVPELVDTLLEEEIIEEHEVEGEEDNELLDFEDMYPSMEELLKENETLEQRVKKLEEKVSILAAALGAKLTSND